ncbi:nuclear transport factor 2 family protein [Microbacterium immunditiarum]|uniref:SnoaL-like domain-containing protein n=1 Tax=Microbacterium immunditiarum TaxID=337480 RepID=A0A7Y9GQ58_9MICO|nr:nuclear transport factor 2 family protein [Microbacterium immunditiarum]NYE20534.1 hypothetical protein [Microbacterium immunditiarum]
MALSTDDIVEIQQLQALYGHAVDAEDPALLARVFSTDAVFDGRGAGPNSYKEGLEAICAWFAKGKPPHPLVHSMTNVWVYEAEDGVRVKAKWFVHTHDGTFWLGDYDDLMHRTEEGWRIKHRVATVRDPRRA